MLDDERLFDELTALQWSPDASGRVALEKKDLLKARLGRSPDYADAVTMLFNEFDNRIVPDLAPSFW